VLNAEILKLSGELLYTKEEYVKLCDEMKHIEKQVVSDARNDSKIELEELRNQLDNEFNEKMKAKENSLTSKHLDNLESEREKWRKESAAELERETERALALAKVDWMDEYKARTEGEVKTALQVAKLEWQQHNESMTRDQETNLAKLKEEWYKQLNVRTKVHISLT
jgi:hypothetical protein